MAVDGLSIHVEDLHKERKTALVFIHSRCLSLKMWEQQLNSDALTDYRLIAFDLPGHGQSEQSNDPMTDYSLQGSLRLLTGLLDQLQLNSYILVGCSIGGHIALQALPRLAGCIGVMALTMPITKPPNFGQMFAAGEIMNRVYGVANPNPTDVSTYADRLVSKQPLVRPAFLEEDFYKTDYRIHEAITQGILADEYDDETEIIRKSGVPIAVVVGADEQFHNLAYLETLALPGIWRNQILAIPQAGHLPGLENPQVLNTILAAFAADCVTH
ncbi:alpha/beta fold hydrolase [Larkinella sp. GY13]|uniref:alpha/beta fold hydrolase n=1 Tax=Larkinella sp. GY13 TaxID=3453720 RepID=UPI003F71D4C1